MDLALLYIRRPWSCATANLTIGLRDNSVPMSTELQLEYSAVRVLVEHFFERCSVDKTS